MFPNEHISCYYIAKTSANPNPSGHLYNAFKKRHEQFKKEYNIRRNQKPEKKYCPPIAPVLPANIDVIRQRLIHRSDPWASVLEDWKFTFEYRRKEVKDNKKLKLAEFLKRWSKFQHKRGVEMVRAFKCL